MMFATRGKLRETRYQNLWDLIVNNDDICFKHVLPRLNPTDLKFLYGVNTETRALVKRSSRKRELKWKFKIEEMSSISTLEFVWENKSLWSGYLWNETSFCIRVALTNKLELLKWAREEKQCEWDYGTIYAAASQGNLEILKYCVANECPINEDACAFVHLLPIEVISSASNTYAKKSKRLGLGVLPLWRLQMVNFIYSNILLSVSMINLTNVRVGMQPRTATWTV